MNQYLRRLSNQQYGEDQSSAASAGLGLLLGAGFLIFLPILLKESEKDFQKAAGSFGFVNTPKQNRMFKKVEHLLTQPENKIERKSLIEYSYSRYWYITYKDGSFQHIPITETGEPVGSGK